MAALEGLAAELRCVVAATAEMQPVAALLAAGVAMAGVAPAAKYAATGACSYAPAATTNSSSSARPSSGARCRGEASLNTAAPRNAKSHGTRSSSPLLNQACRRCRHGSTCSKLAAVCGTCCCTRLFAVAQDCRHRAVAELLAVVQVLRLLLAALVLLPSARASSAVKDRDPAHLSAHLHQVTERATPTDSQARWVSKNGDSAPRQANTVHKAPA